MQLRRKKLRSEKENVTEGDGEDTAIEIRVIEVHVAINFPI